MYTIPCEAIFNNHPRVFRSALVGVGPPPTQKPVICIELDPSDKGNDKERLTEELLVLAKSHELTRTIETVLYHKSFPVDIRHNSKIFREKLTVWAEKQLK
jgi:acyl-CoA synthetase (AMP-forming)/AMP-acid ligase II